MRVQPKYTMPEVRRIWESLEIQGAQVDVQIKRDASGHVCDTGTVVMITSHDRVQGVDTASLVGCRNFRMAAIDSHIATKAVLDRFCA